MKLKLVLIVAAGLLAFTGDLLAAPITSAISSNFNGTAIPANDFIWFNSVVSASNLGSNPVTVYVTDSTIQFTANSTPYTVNVPNATITFSPTAASAATTFDTATNTWLTTVPSGLAGKSFLDGVGFQVPIGGLPGGINPVTWTNHFSADTPNVGLHWQWAAAVYTSFSPDNNALGVKPVDSNTGSIYLNSDHAGTPENYKSSLTGGTRGGGGSNFTGSYSGTAHCVPPVPPPFILAEAPEPASVVLLGLGLGGLGGHQFLLRRRRSAGTAAPRCSGE